MKKRKVVIALIATVKIVIAKIVNVATLRNVIVHKKAPIIWHDDRRPNSS